MNGSAPPDRLDSLPVRDLLDAVAARTTAPGGGAAAALTTSLAAALTAMAARFDGAQATSGALATAEDARARAADLADADVAAYAGYVAARRARTGDVQRALDVAVDVPMHVAELAEQVALTASALARDGNPRLRGDAVTACWLAAAAARSAACLVAENLADHPDDLRTRRAGDAARRAHDSALAVS